MPDGQLQLFIGFSRSAKNNIGTAAAQGEFKLQPAGNIQSQPGSNQAADQHRVVVAFNRIKNTNVAQRFFKSSGELRGTFQQSPFLKNIQR